jgi:hypothetical protein
VSVASALGKTWRRGVKQVARPGDGKGRGGGVQAQRAIDHVGITQRREGLSSLHVHAAVVGAIGWSSQNVMGSPTRSRAAAGIERATTLVDAERDRDHLVEVDPAGEVLPDQLSRGVPIARVDQRRRATVGRLVVDNSGSGGGVSPT